jgi:hypothetical protein
MSDSQAAARHANLGGVTDLDRRQFIGAGLAAAAGAYLGLPVRSASASTALRKMIDIGPGGVIYPGSAQDLRYASNTDYFAETGTKWIRMWADWPSLQPHPGFAIDDPRSPGYWRLQGLDAQIALANSRGIKVILMPYRFPTWVNGTATLSAQKDTDAEISYRYGDRMTKAAWDRYVRNGRNPAAYNPSRRALEYMLPTDPYGPSSAWAQYFDFLYRRYGYQQRATGRYVHGFELVNEPNLQLWPQQGATTTDPFAQTPRTIERAIAQLFKTAGAISKRYAESTVLYGPSISDSDTTTSRLYTRYDAFVPAFLDACAAIGHAPSARVAWTHHNYTDVEKRQTSTRTQLIRGLLAGRWTGLAGAQSPTVFITEGGARLSRMPALYPAEDPRQAQAKCLRDAWALHRSNSGAGVGVSMLAQYLLYADPNFDCGLLDPYPSTVKRPAYEAWKSFPTYS